MHGIDYCLTNKKKLLIVGPPRKFFFLSVRAGNHGLFDLRHERIITLPNSLRTVLSYGYFFLFILLFFKYRVKIFISRITFLKATAHSKLVVDLGRDVLWLNGERETQRALDLSVSRDLFPIDLGNIELDPVWQTRGEEILRSLKSPLRPIVVFHWRSYGGGNCRSSHLESYISSLELLSDSGYNIFMVGDECDDLNIDGLVNLTKIKNREELDILIISRCQFFFGIPSGPGAVARLFSKPTVTVNHCEFLLSWPIHPRSIFIPKRLDVCGDTYIREMVEFGATLNYSDTRVEGKKYRFIDNTADEILQTLNEYLEASNRVSTAFQSNFKTQTFNTLRKIIENQETPRSQGAVRISSHVDRNRFLTSNSFSGNVAGHFARSL